MTKVMQYFKTENKLIQYNPETKVYKQMNNIKKIDTRISHNDFLLLNAIQIKKQEYCRLMNIFFKNIKHEWKFEHSYFRKLDNFESDNQELSKNYIIGVDVPLHSVGKHNHLILVYHWGRVYYHTISYGGYTQGQLIDIKTGNIVSWCKLKHCSPIFNIGIKEIC